MALISCPNCGKQVSDKAPSCPSCGCVLFEEEPKKLNVIICEDCGFEVPDGVESCPNCGCPIENKQNIPKSEDSVQKVEVTSVNVSVNKSRIIKILSIVLVLAVIIIAAVIGIQSSSKKKAVADYASNYNSAVTTMLTGSYEAETCCSLIKSVWYNTIYEESDPKTDKYTRKKSYYGSGYGSFNDDFNTSLANLFADSSFKSKVSSIETNQSEVASLMKNLNNPPEEYRDAYDALKDFYEAYTELTNLATNPSGSLSTYSSSYNSADSKVLTEYNKTKLYMN